MKPKQTKDGDAATAGVGYYVELGHARNPDVGGDWTGGRVTDSAGVFVARVSYNGRLWDRDGYEIAQDGIKTVVQCGVPVDKAEVTIERVKGESEL